MAGTYTYRCRYCQRVYALPRVGGKPREVCDREPCRRVLRRKRRPDSIPCRWCGLLRHPAALLDGDCREQYGGWENSCHEQRARAGATFPDLDVAHGGDLIFGFPPGTDHEPFIP